MRPEIDWKSREAFSGLKVPDDIPVIVRVDGWRFHKVAKETGLERPYDRKLASYLSSVPLRLMLMGFPIALAYTFSDEISFVVRPPLPWEGRVEKLISTLASYSAAVVSKMLGVPAAFDGRVVMLRGAKEVPDYLTWRQMEAWRNMLNSYAQLALERRGYSKREVAEILKGKRSEDLHELIYRDLGVNPAKLPGWQRRGILVGKKEIGRETPHGVAIRKIPVVLWNPPLFGSEEGRDLIFELLRVAGLDF